MSNIVWSHTSKWFTANKLPLDPPYMNIKEATMNNAFIKTEYDVKYMEEPVNTEFLGIK